MTFSELINLFGRYLHRFNDVDVTQLCLLAEGTNANTLQTQAAIVYVVGNTQVSKAVTNNIAMTACTQQAISTFCYYLVSGNAAGTITTTKGTDNTYALPATPAGNAAIAAFKIVTDASHTFTSGSVDLSAAGITATYYDIDCGIAAYLINQAMQRLERGVTITRNGIQRSIMDWTWMLVRATAVIDQGDDTVTLPFPKYKDFVDNSLTITDSLGTVYPLLKEDVMPLGYSLQNRPVRIARLPEIELTFTLDGAPALDFTIWPESDDDYTIDVTAYQYSPALDGVIYATNWLTQYAPDVLLFGALVEAAAYFPADARMAEWKDRYNEAVWNLMAAQERERVSGSMIYTKYPNALSNRVTDLAMSSNWAGIASYGFIGNNSD